jgi:hypothetical protein
MDRKEFETLLGDIEIDIPSGPKLMTREQFTGLQEWLKQKNPMGSMCDGSLHWLVNNGFVEVEDVKANIAALVGLLSALCDDYHISRLKADEWEECKNDDPNRHMDDAAWDSYIETIISDATCYQIRKQERGK